MSLDRLPAEGDALRVLLQRMVDRIRMLERRPDGGPGSSVGSPLLVGVWQLSDDGDSFTFTNIETGDELSFSSGGALPVAHAASHESGGSDAIDLSDQFSALGHNHGGVIPANSGIPAAPAGLSEANWGDMVSISWNALGIPAGLPDFSHFILQVDVFAGAFVFDTRVDAEAFLFALPVGIPVKFRLKTVTLYNESAYSGWTSTFEGVGPDPDAADAGIRTLGTGAQQAAAGDHAHDYLPLDGSDPMTGSLDMGANQIANLADGVNNDDAATYGQLITYYTAIPDNAPDPTADVTGLALYPGFDYILATWTANTEVDMVDGYGWYQVQLDRAATFDSNGGQPDLNIYTHGSAVPLPNLAFDTTYYVRVKAIDAHNDASVNWASDSTTTIAIDPGVIDVWALDADQYISGGSYDGVGDESTDPDGTATQGFFLRGSTGEAEFAGTVYALDFIGEGSYKTISAKRVASLDDDSLNFGAYSSDADDERDAVVVSEKDKYYYAGAPQTDVTDERFDFKSPVTDGDRHRAVLRLVSQRLKEEGQPVVAFPTGDYVRASEPDEPDKDAAIYSVAPSFHVVNGIHSDPLPAVTIQSYPGFRAFKTAGTNTVNNTLTTAAFADSDRTSDPWGGWDQTLNRWTVPAEWAQMLDGMTDQNLMMEIGFRGFWVANATGVRQFAYRVNGGAEVYIAQQQGLAVYGNWMSASVHAPLQPGDNLQFRIYQNRGGNLFCESTMAWVSLLGTADVALPHETIVDDHGSGGWGSGGDPIPR